METALVLASVTVALAAAIRSTWSPCGLSMLSTITPVAERGRGHRYGVTVAWFVLGATLGGMTLGIGAAVLAAIVGTFTLMSTTVAAGALAAAIAVASDLRMFGFRLPGHTRQVDDRWLGQYRAWVYATGFGWQIGVGLATYIMTAGVYLMIVLAALTGSPAFAFGVMTLFGLVRGLAVLLGARLTTPARVFAFHRRFDALGATTRVTMVAVETAMMIVLLAAILGFPALALFGMFVPALLQAQRVEPVATAPAST